MEDAAHYIGAVDEFAAVDDYPYSNRGCGCHGHLSLPGSSRFGVLRYDIWNDTVTDENKKRGEDKKCGMDAFVVKVHEETSKGIKRLYLYPLFLYTIKKSGKYFTLHTSVNFLFQLRNRIWFIINFINKYVQFISFRQKFVKKEHAWECACSFNFIRTTAVYHF